MTIESREEEDKNQSCGSEPSPAEAFAVFAGGCFWGVEHLMQQQPGVIAAVSGYMGGNVENPSYEQVKAHLTGHAEVVKVSYDPAIVSYETLAKLFFEIHDPTQRDGQGVDIGDQYRSEVFYANEEQRVTTLALIDQLKALGYDVVTKVTPLARFYTAEEYHQDYCEIKGIEPECHMRVRRFQ